MAELDRQADELAAAHEIGFLHRNFANHAFGRRIAAGDRERAGRLILDRDHDDDTVGRRTRLVGDRHFLEVTEIVQPPFGTIDDRLVIGVALADIELAADDVVTGARIAANVDSLDVDARAFVDDEGDA